MTELTDGLCRETALHMFGDLRGEETVRAAAELVRPTIEFAVGRALDLVARQVGDMCTYRTRAGEPLPHPHPADHLGICPYGKVVERIQATAEWCGPDNCPAAICGGPHHQVRTSLGIELLREGQEPIGTPRPDQEGTGAG